jgi:hypothetical protein
VSISVSRSMSMCWDSSGAPTLLLWRTATGWRATLTAHSSSRHPPRPGRPGRRNTPNGLPSRQPGGPRPMPRKTCQSGSSNLHRLGSDRRRRVQPSVLLARRQARSRHRGWWCVSHGVPSIPGSRAWARQLPPCVCRRCGGGRGSERVGARHDERPPGTAFLASMNRGQSPEVDARRRGHHRL